MTIDKKVDVIILSWDRAEDTKKAIISAVEQQNIDLNVYVVDQGSKIECVQDIETLVNEYPNVHLQKNITNTGVPEGRNQASELGNGDYIVSLDNDAEFLTPFELEKVVKAYDTRPKTAVIAFNIKRFGTESNDESSWSYGLSSVDWSNRDFFTTRFVGAGHAIRRSAFEQVNGYDNSLFFLHEEVDLSRRFINLGYEIEYLHNIGVGHKVSAEHRVAWNAGRWTYHARNKTYLSLKLKSPLLSVVFHSFLLQIDGLKKGMPIDTLKATYAGFKMYQKNKFYFNLAECAFNPDSEEYYRKYTPGADGSVPTRILRRIKGIIK
ncbi:N-glycosyltransferase [Shewanella sp. P1-14-1]|uniref:glycosyltransferase family 2 protein n=1 Tax=Shewanella sp. P1-14-1 TaxID=1723761 RepID=UPI0006D65F53|nr:glycosyltransferase [Shewanella sp. P1-14-1]KPZ72586.1 N-glycosyltransferase [Shewanella sp. P1-14-1]